MKKGKWNYTEDIYYKVILVRLHKVEEPPMHWQNAFAGQERQVLDIWYTIKGVEKHFYIDNYDGSGLLKISKGGGPDSYSAHVSGFSYLRDLPESEWQQFDKHRYEISRVLVDEWQKTNFPEDFKKMEALREMIRSGALH